jgi:hypothetical protein
VDRFKDLPEDEQQEIEVRRASRLRQPMIIAIGHIAPFPADWWGRGGDRRAAVDSDYLAGIIWPGRNAPARRQLRDPTVRLGLRELLETVPPCQLHGVIASEREAIWGCRAPVGSGNCFGARRAPRNDTVGFDLRIVRGACSS